MSTYMAKMGETVRKWYILDAAGKPLGKTAVVAADLLRGKRKPEYTPHADCGDNVIIINAAQAVLTGKKGTQKFYRTHSGWVGGLKETPYRILMQEQPRDSHARGGPRHAAPELPEPRVPVQRLHIYADANFEQQAQKPEAYGQSTNRR